jgi:predicted TIM-barrel fold metal-dependent hydrolase
MVVDHVGTPLGLGKYAGRRDERFATWQASIRALATCPNVMMKLGGLAMPFVGFEGMGPDVRPSSSTLAELWRPYIETCIDAFDLHKQGNGARTIGIYLNLTTAQADCAIDAGRDITKQEIPQ